MSPTNTLSISPKSTDSRELAEVLGFFETQANLTSAAVDATFMLSAAGHTGQVVLTSQLAEILKNVVQALSQGQSINILTQDQEVSTQQAAEILGLSRPTVVKLISDGELTARVPGSVRRKLRLAEVLAYQQQLSTRQNQFITESSAEYPETEAVEVSKLLAQARLQK